MNSFRYNFATSNYRAVAGPIQPASLAVNQDLGGVMFQNSRVTFQQISERFLTSPNNFLPVVDERGRLTGMVALHDMKNFLNTGTELNGVIAPLLPRTYHWLRSWGADR